MAKYSDEERAAILAEARRRLAEADEIISKQRPLVEIEEPLVKWRREAEERDAAKQAELREREQEQRRRELEHAAVGAVAAADVDARIAQAILAERAATLNVINEALSELADVIGREVGTLLTEVDQKLAGLEKLVVRSVPEPSSKPNGLPAMRNVN